MWRSTRLERFLLQRMNAMKKNRGKKFVIIVYSLAMVIAVTVFLLVHFGVVKIR